MSKKYTICTIGGDGIGPELVSATIRLLQSTNMRFNFVEGHAGYECFQKRNTSLPEETINNCQNSDAVLFGSVTTPPMIDNYSSPVIKLRKILDLYANVRPIFSLPVAGLRQGIDFVIVRENTEGLYVGDEKKIPGGFVAHRIITKKACDRIIRFAFDLAKTKKRSLVTVVHKANILRQTDGLFLKTAQQIAKQYSDITLEDMLVDATAMRLIKKPEHFDVIVTTNMFGDILSDESAMLVGGLGVAASANIGDDFGLFEPIHGSAPKYAGKNYANPLGCFFAGCMMLDYLGQEKYAETIRHAIVQTIKQGCTTKDLGGDSSTTEVTGEVIKNMKNDRKIIKS